jgi:hypothetical protein
MMFGLSVAGRVARGRGVDLEEQASEGN